MLVRYATLLLALTFSVLGAETVSGTDGNNPQPPLTPFCCTATFVNGQGHTACGPTVAKCDGNIAAKCSGTAPVCEANGQETGATVQCPKQGQFAECHEKATR